MAVSQQIVQQFNFGGGLNLTSDPIHVKDNETTDCQNVDFDVRGAVKKRLGSVSKFGPEPNPPFDFLLPYRSPAGVSQLLAVRYGFGVLAFDTAYSATVLSGSTQTTGFPNHGTVAGANAYIVNGQDGTLRVNGTTATRLGTTVGATGHHPKVRYVAFHKGRLFLAHQISNPSRIVFTGSDANPADLEYFKGTSFVDFDPDDGDEITGIMPFLDQLTVFKRNKIFTLRGNNPSSYVRVLANPALGAVAPRSIQAWDKGVMFLSTRGVFSFDGARATRVSEKIDPALNELPAEALATAAGLVYQQRYYLFVNEDSSNAWNETTYVFDFTTGTWTKYRGWNVRHATIWNRVGADEMLGIDHVSSDRIVQYRVPGTNADLGAAIAAHFTTKWFDFGTPARRKMGRKLYVYFVASGQHNVNVDVYKSFQTAGPSNYQVSVDPLGAIWGTGNWGEMVWGAGLDTIQRRLAGLGTHTAFRLKVYDSSTNPWTFEGAEFVLTPRNLR